MTSPTRDARTVAAAELLALAENERPSAWGVMGVEANPSLCVVKRSDVALVCRALLEGAQDRERLAELSAAATEVNARYIGGSPLNGRLGEALERLAQANAAAIAATRPTTEDTRR